MYADPAGMDRLLRNLPPIRRSRFWRLYSHSGKRYLDLWMDGGRILLGAGGHSIGKVFKAAIDQGLTRPVPSHWEMRVKKQLTHAWSDFPVSRFFTSESRAMECARQYKSGLVILRPFDEYLEPNYLTFSIYAMSNVNSSGTMDTAKPILPCPSALAPGILLFRTEEAADGITGDLVPPAQLAALSRSLTELVAFSESFTEKHWKRADRFTESAFLRRGPYLFPRYAKEAHNDFFMKALCAGLLVSPDFGSPSIIPGEFDDGELVRMPGI